MTTIRILLFLLVALLPLRADDVLFIGNSYTYGDKGKDGATPVTAYGGVPKLLEAIAASKGKSVTTRMVVSGGKNWAWHLAQPATDEALHARPWDWIVLQDFSTEPTHLGDPGQFRKDGEEFLRRIQAAAPGARIVLYETWARAKEFPFYTGASTPKSFTGPAEMTAELQKNYRELAQDLKVLDPQRIVVVAPVGTAFALSLERNPGIDLHNHDRHHGSTEGYYLSALVFYATLFHDSPVGAAASFGGFALDPDRAKALQEAAAAATAR